MTRRPGGQDEKVAMLRDLEFFGECTPDELERIARISTEVQVAAGKLLTRQGDMGTEFFVIVDGEAGVDVDGTRVAQLGRGSFFGEHALLQHSARNASVTAITPMTVLVLNRREFESMLVDAPNTASTMLREIIHRVNPSGPT